MQIDIRGPIIPNDYAEVYEWLGMEYTSPSMVNIDNPDEDITVNINSNGGDIFSGSEIYTKLKNHKGKVTTVVTGLAASMASVVAMAGDVIKMSPTAQMMIHNVSTFTAGDKNDMTHEAEVLSGCDKTIANAYRLKTGLSEDELLALMDDETWLTAQDAKEKGFIDEILFDDAKTPVLLNSETPILAKEVINKVKNQIHGGKMSKELKQALEDEELTNVKPDEEETKESPDEKEETKEETPEKQEEAPQEEKPEEKEEPNEEEETEETTEEKKEEDPKEQKGNAEAKLDNFNLKDEILPRAENKVGEFKNEAEGKNLKTIGGTNEVKNNYREAFFNSILGKSLTASEMAVIDEENKAFNNVFTHDTKNTALVIPRTTQDKIWARATEGYGVLEDVVRLNVKGELRMVKHTAITEGDAKWYVEGTDTEDEKNTFGELILKGHELSKAVTISWKLKAMAMDDFENYLINEIGQRISVALGTAVTKGDGNNQPKGIIKALEADKDQQVEVKETGKLTYTEITSAVAKIHSSYKKGAKIYANSNVIWTVLANVVDGMGRPFFMPAAGTDGVANILGFTVKEDASLDDKEIIIGNVPQGYVFNVNEEMSITVEDHAKPRKTDYVGYMVADGDVIDTKAFAHLKLVQAV